MSDEFPKELIQAMIRFVDRYERKFSCEHRRLEKACMVCKAKRISMAIEKYMQMTQGGGK